MQLQIYMFYLEIYQMTDMYGKRSKSILGSKKDLNKK